MDRRAPVTTGEGQGRTWRSGHCGPGVCMCVYSVKEMCAVFRVEVVCVKAGGFVCLRGLKARGE